MNTYRFNEEINIHYNFLNFCKLQIDKKIINFLQNLIGMNSLLDLFSIKIILSDNNKNATIYVENNFFLILIIKFFRLYSGLNIFLVNKEENSEIPPLELNCIKNGINIDKIVCAFCSEKIFNGKNNNFRFTCIGKISHSGCFYKAIKSFEGFNPLRNIDRILYPISTKICSNIINNLKENIDFSDNILETKNAQWNYFHHATYHNNTCLVEAIANLGIDINKTTSNGYTPIYISTKMNCISSFLKLIELGADINKKNNNGCTPLHSAIICKNIEFSYLLIKNGANVYETDEMNRTALLVAVDVGSLELVEILLKNGFDINYFPENKNGMTALFYSMIVKNFEITNYLLKMGANPYLICDGFSTISFALFNNFREIIPVLRDEYNLECYEKIGQIDIFTISLEKRNFETIDLILEYFPKVSIFNYCLCMRMDMEDIFRKIMHNLDDDNQMIAVCYGLKYLKILFDSGFDINYRNVDYETALMVASSTGDLEVLEYLLNKGADPNLKNKLFQNALFYAKSCEVVKILLDNKIDLNQICILGTNPLLHFLYLNRLDIVELLYKNGANAYIFDKMNNCAIKYALENCGFEIFCD